MKPFVRIALGLLIFVSPSVWAQQPVVVPGPSDLPAWSARAPEMDVETVGFLRIAVDDLPAIERWLSEEMGFSPWPLGQRASGEESIMVMLSSGQSVEFFSRRPFYEQLEMKAARTVGLAFYVPSIATAMMSLAGTGVPTTEVISLHAGGEPTYPRLLDLLFIRSFEFPLWNFSFAERNAAGIEKVRQDYPQYDDRKWQDHPNGVTGISEVWFGVRDLEGSERALAALALVPDEARSAPGERVYALDGMVLRLVSAEHRERGEEIARRIAGGGEGAFHLVFSSSGGAVEPGARAIPESELLLEVQ